MIHCVVFDFDGTLADSNEIKRRGYFVAARELDPSGESVQAACTRCSGGDRHCVAVGIVDELRSRGLAPEDTSSQALARRLVAAYSAHCEEAVSACAEVPGASAALDELKRGGVPLFVNTATPHEAIVPILERRGLGGLFAGVHGGPASKLDNLRTISTRTGVGPGSILMVGDGEDDRLAALAFGCHFLGIRLRGSQRRFSQMPPRCLPDLQCFSSVLAEMNTALGDE